MVKNNASIIPKSIEKGSLVKIDYYLTGAAYTRIETIDFNGKPKQIIIPGQKFMECIVVTKVDLDRGILEGLSSSGLVRISGSFKAIHVKTNK